MRQLARYAEQALLRNDGTYFVAITRDALTRAHMDNHRQRHLDAVVLRPTGT